MAKNSPNQPDQTNGGSSKTQPAQELSPKPETVKYRYHAFLSYAHEDKPTVAWLHKLLTTFWAPGKGQRMIFMDQESLPADGGLTKKLRDALRESRHLIVCCSKSSVESFWVNAEIDEFLKSHAPEKVLACLVGARGGDSFEIPPGIQNIEKRLNDELLKPDLRGYPEALKGAELKASVKEALSLLAPLVDLPSKNVLLNQRRQPLILGLFLALFFTLAIYGAHLWADRPQSQIDKILAKSPDLVKITAATDNINSLESIGPWLKALALTGRSNEALDTTRYIDGGISRFEARVVVIESLVKIGKTEEALDAAYKIDDAYFRSETLAGIVRALAVAGKTEEALNTACNIEDADSRSEALAGVVKTLAVAGKTEQMERAAIDALDATRKAEDARIRCHTLIRVAVALSKAGKTEQMEQVAIEAIDAARKIKDAFYRSQTLLSAVMDWADAGKPKEAINAVRAIEDARYRSEALVGVAVALAEAGKMEEAISFALKIENVKDRSMALSQALMRVVKAHAEAGRTEEALNAAHNIEDADSRSQALVGVVKGLAKANKFEQMDQAGADMLDAVGKIEGAYARSQALIRLFEALAETGKPEIALAIARNIDDPYSRSQAIASAVKAMAVWRGTEDMAKYAIEEAQKAAEQIDKEDDKSKALADVAIGLAKLHLYREARELVDLNKVSAADKLRAYTAILREYHIERFPDQAKLFEEEKKEAQ